MSTINKDIAIIRELAKQYMDTRKGEFILPADKTLSGNEERYPFTFENLGCCGASTIYVYF